MSTCLCGCGRPPMRYAAWAKGHKPKKPPRTLRTYEPYSVKDNETILHFRDRGWSYAKIAKRLKRTARGVARQWNLMVQRLGDTMMSSSDVARTFRISRDTVCTWVRKGWLPKRRIGRTHRFTDQELEAFIENQQTWGNWWPERMSEGYWKDRAVAARNIRLLSVADVSRSIHVCERSILKHIEKGNLRAIPGMAGPHGSFAYWVPETELGRLQEMYGIAS